MLVPIVLPIYNEFHDKELGFQVAMRCGSSIRTNTDNYLVVAVIDGTSDERVVWMAQSMMYSIHTINPIASGAVCAYNRGLDIALKFKTDFVCILNSDTVVPPGWLDKMMLLMRRNESIGMVVPTFNNCGPNDQQNHSCEPRPDKQLGDSIGSCVLFRTEALKQIGLYDERFNDSYGREDTDMCDRMHNMGWEIWLKGDVCLHHEMSTSFGDKFGGDYTNDQFQQATAKSNEIYEEKRRDEGQ